MFIMDDGMCDNLLVTGQVVNPILTARDLPENAEEQMAYIRDCVSSGIDQKEEYSLDEAVKQVVSGLVVLFIDGVPFCECFGVQGFPKRSIENAQTEVQERGAQEAFVESFKDNVALIRRRIRSPVARFEVQEVGTTAKRASVFVILPIVPTNKPLKASKAGWVRQNWTSSSVRVICARFWKRKSSLCFPVSAQPNDRTPPVRKWRRGARSFWWTARRLR